MALQDIQPGDQVIYTEANRQRSIHTVERVTKTQIILTSGSRFRRSDGCPLGSSEWTMSHLVPATDELVAAVKDKQTRRKLSAMLNQIAMQVQDTRISFNDVVAHLNRLTSDLTRTTNQ